MDEMMTYLTTVKDAVCCGLPWEKLSGSRILVVGATGLIGGCLVDVLMNREGIDYKVYAAGRNEARARQRFIDYAGNSHFEFVRMDVTQEIDETADFDYIIDAASGANPRLYSTDPVGVMRSNFLGVDHLLSYGRRHHLKRFVYVSSGEVYGEGTVDKFTEDYSGYVDPTRFRSCYPSSKRAAETLCASYAHQYGLEACIARPSHVYGPHFTDSDSRVYAQFIRNVLNGEDIVMKSTGAQFRSWCYVVDCATAILYILLNGQNGEAYNIADDSSNITIRQLADMTAEIAHRKVVIELPEDVEKDGFTVITKAVFDTTKLESLGWKPSSWTMRQKMEATIEEERQLHDCHR